MSNAGYSQLPGGSGDHERRQAQLVASTYDVLQRTGESIQRSNQIAIETENMGAEVGSRKMRIYRHINFYNPCPS